MNEHTGNVLHTLTLSHPMLRCHFLNSLSQLRMVFSGHTTSAVLNFRFLDSSTVWRNATTCNHSTAMLLEAQRTEDWATVIRECLFVEAKCEENKTTGGGCVRMFTCRVFPRPMQCARIQPDPGEELAVLTDSQQQSQINCTPV